MLLGHNAQPNARAHLYASPLRLKATFDQSQQSRFARPVLANERQTLARADLEADVLEECRRARVTEADVLELQHSPPASRRAEVQEVQVDWPVQLRPLDAFVRVQIPLELSLTALGQRGLLAREPSDAGLARCRGRLDGPRNAFVAADIALDAVDIVLLATPRVLLDSTLLGSGSGELAIRTPIGSDCPSLGIEVKNATDRRVEKRPIVRYEQHRSRVAGQERLEPFERAHVEIVVFAVAVQEIVRWRQRRNVFIPAPYELARV